MKLSVVALCVCLCASVCVFASQAPAESPAPPARARAMIERRARQAISALKSKDMTRLAALVHPEKGLRFSPYADVNPQADLIFTRRQLKTLSASKRRYVWGAYDGSGDAIRLTFANYYRHFVYDHDYAKAVRVSYNGEPFGRGTTPNLIRAVYPEAIVVEHHFPGFDEKYGGMDWKSLWLVFEKKDEAWYLVGIVHGEWTI
jgi:hypothetical protein